MPYLEIKLGPDTLLLRFVGRVDFVFGRLPRADVQLRDMKVSRLHTQMFIDSRGGAFVRDLGSSGGTFFGNARMRRGVIAPLTDSAKVRIGDAAITFYDAEPPVNATEPPARSGPRGLIRTNDRERYFEAEATVLAVDKIDPETQSGPAEPPPEVNPAEFADDAAAPKKAPPARPPKKTKPDTGIVEAPWEKRESGRVAPSKRDVKVAIPGAQKDAPPPMPTAAYDETGKVEGDEPSVVEPTTQQAYEPTGRVEPVPPEELEDVAESPQQEEAEQTLPRNDTPSTAPEDGLDETGRTSREAAVPPAVENFRPPPPVQGDMPQEQDEPAPKVGMPTVRLERPAIQDRQKALEEEEPAPKLPTASVKPVEAEEIEEEPPAPQIGTRVKGKDAADAGDGEESAGAESKSGDEQPDDDEELTDEQIADYLGASKSGRIENVDFGEDEDSAAAEDEEEEVEFGAAAKVSVDVDEEIDIEDEPAPEAEADPAESSSETPDTSEDEPESSEDVAEVKEYGEKKTPPPPTRKGATGDKAFKPKKTRKLMKRRRETAKITDKSSPTPPPSGEKTALVEMDQPIAQGAKTMFIPKPDDAKLSRGPVEDETGEAPQAGPEKATGKPKGKTENKSLDEMGGGPGGDTVALPPAMMKKLQSELKSKPKPKSAPKERPETIGDNPTVKLNDDEEDEEEFILDEDYAFFTPPPPTNRPKGAQEKESDVIDANDFATESESLPDDKKAKKANEDTIVE